MASRLTPMSAVDRSWLRMESAENPMMISAVLAFDKKIPIQRLKRLLEERFLVFDRFRQRVVDRGDHVDWEFDPLFHIDNHLHLAALPGKADQASLQAFVSDLNSTALDTRHPLWQMHYIDQYRGGSALLIRIHHCIADGISLVRVLLSLTDSKPDGDHKIVRKLRRQPRRNPPSRIESLRRTLQKTRQVARDQATLFLKSLREEPDYPLKVARAAGDIAVDLIKLGLTPGEPKTGLKPELSGRKNVAWAEPLSLAEVKVCGRALGGTVNDVLLSVASGALQKHFEAAAQTPPDCGVRVAVPFNLRPIHQPIETLGNQFGLVLVTLPVDVIDPVMRFRQVQDTMIRLKRSYQAQVTYSLLDIFGRGPDILERRALGLLSKKASAVLTNVPGPREAVYLGGAKLVQPMFWVPQSGDIGIGMSIFSYAGTVQFGLTVDQNIKVDPNAMTNYFRTSFEELYDAATHLESPGRRRKAS